MNRCQDGHEELREEQEANAEMNLELSFARPGRDCGMPPAVQGTALSMGESKVGAAIDGRDRPLSVDRASQSWLTHTLQAARVDVSMKEERVNAAADES